MEDMFDTTQSEHYDPAENQFDERRGYRNLYASIINTAILDLTRGRTHFGFQDRQYYERAIDWFWGKADCQVSFEFACEVIEQDPRIIRARLVQEKLLPDQPAQRLPRQSATEKTRRIRAALLNKGFVVSVNPANVQEPCHE